MIACPGVIERAFIKPDRININFNPLSGSNTGYIILALLYISGNDHKRLKTKDSSRYLDIAFKHFIQLIPFGLAMRPGQLYTTLVLPFCRQSAHNQEYFYLQTQI